jgi:hypothetical protein
MLEPFLSDNPCRNTCTLGSNCCGNSIYYAVYRNPNLLGCYEPPIPGTSLIGTATYPVACFSTVYSQTITPTRIYNNPDPSGVYTPTATAPRQYDWTINTFEYLGCYAPGTMNVVGTPSVVNTNNPKGCASQCSAFPFFSIAWADGLKKKVLVLVSISKVCD